MAVSSLLIVDDEKQLGNILTENLEPIGVTVLVATDGLAALELIRKSRFDAVLCDVRMPGMDGISLLQRVREEGLDTPFVFLSGFADVPELLSALRLGATDFLEKPWAAPDLLRAIKCALDIGHCQKHLLRKIQAAIPHDGAQAMEEIEEYRKRLSSLRARR
jgi:CheY-like chemotaxis protein